MAPVCTQELVYVPLENTAVQVGDAHRPGDYDVCKVEFPLLLLLMGAWDCGPAALLQVVAQVKRRGCLHARTNRSMHLVSCWDGE